MFVCICCYCSINCQTFLYKVTEGLKQISFYKFKTKSTKYTLATFHLLEKKKAVKEMCLLAIIYNLVETFLFSLLKFITFVIFQYESCQIC